MSGGSLNFISQMLSGIQIWALWEAASTALFFMFFKPMFYNKEVVERYFILLKSIYQH